ncbi:ras-domain-containing protein [Meredithblackwellia eburnea MCA 4105]
MRLWRPPVCGRWGASTECVTFWKRSHDTNCDGGVGKSCITASILNRAFNEEWDPTLEDSYTLNLTVDGIAYAIELVDTAGQEEYRGLWGESTVREGDGFIFCYAIDSQSSFELLPMFLHTVRKVKSPVDNPSQSHTPENTPFPFIILGNKCDVPPSTRTISAQQGLQFARGAGGLFYETSAKLRVNIEAAFVSVVRATANSRKAHEDWVRRFGGNDDGFNGNVVVLERGLTSPRSTGPGRVALGEGGWEEEEDGPIPTEKRKRNPNLAMDRRRSFSVGGLGAHPDTLNGDKGGGCCSSCIIS